MSESEDREKAQLKLEAEKDKLFELYEEHKALEDDIVNQNAWLERLFQRRRKIKEILTGKAPLLP